jgi:hypothetical protein
MEISSSCIVFARGGFCFGEKTFVRYEFKVERVGYQALSLPFDRAPTAMDIVFGEANPP